MDTGALTPAIRASLATMADDDPDDLERLLAAPPEPGRFLTLQDVATYLATSHAQVYAMVRRRELRAIKIGGRGQWRVASSDLEAWIQRGYADTERFIAEHPFNPGDPPDDRDDDQGDAGGS